MCTAQKGAMLFIFLKEKPMHHHLKIKQGTKEGNVHAKEQYSAKIFK